MSSEVRTHHACLQASVAELHRLADTFRAWRVPSDSAAAAYPLECLAATIKDAVAKVAPRCSHKDTLLILGASTRTGKRVLHAYRIKQGKRVYAMNRVTGVPEWTAPLYAEAQFSVPVSAFDPIEPWKWSPGCDVVGIDRDIVEQRA